MKADWKAFCACLVVLIALGAEVHAQAPATNGASAAGAAGAPTAAPAASPGGITGLIQMIAAQKAACKAKLCSCPIGQLFTNILKPINAVTGGLLCTSCCDDLKQKQDQAKPSNSAQGACAKIMAEEAEMNARRAAVRCLAHADCHWWPEAEESLINALRTDRNECVRLEAALVLGTGCCCTKKTIEALTIVVTGSDKDANPYENSERVKAAAAGSLQHCLACYEERPQRPEAPKPKPEQPAKEKPTAMQDNSIQRTSYYAQADQRSSAEVIENARRALQQMQAAPPAPARPGPPTGHRNIYSLLTAAAEQSASAAATHPVDGALEPPLDPVPARTPASATMPAKRPTRALLSGPVE